MFSKYHANVNMLFFISVIFITMFFMHPTILIISYVSSFLYSVKLGGRAQLKLNALLILMMLLITLINPLFNHQGVTNLLFINNNPITLESVFFGLASAVMLASVIMWFSAFNKIMTSDKIITSVGKIIPVLSLIFTIVLRLIPRYKEKFAAINEAQRSIGQSTGDGDILTRITNTIAIISALISWALENTIETSITMNSRGFGLSGRTYYFPTRFESKDRNLLIFLLGVLVVITAGIINNSFKFWYFPSVVSGNINILSVAAFTAFAALCFIPLLLDIKEDLLWKYYTQKI